MRAKKKREVDPNAPPRPNLMRHNVQIRSIEQTLNDMENQLSKAQQRIEQLEQKNRRQTAYMQAVHNTVSKLKK